jgi:prepilin-type N-terminal cleavage/methylation domain-containing protein
MNNKKGFSLVELLVAMAIIAVLISIAAFGIGILQRNSRNTVRRNELNNIRLALIEREGNTGTPISALTSTSGSTLTISTGFTYTFHNSFTTSLIANPCPPVTAETDSRRITLCMTATAPRTLYVGLEGSTTPASLRME